MRVLAIDFGTSNTVAAVSVDGSPPRLLTIDGSPLVPSSIYLAEDGTFAVGRDADRQARIDPSRYEPNPKRCIDEGEILLGTDVVPVRQAIAAVLGRVLQEFRRQFDGAKPDVVRLTHPARWRKTRRDVLVAACREAGLGDDPILVPEPVGAATHFVTQGGHNMGPGSALAVYDLGGGTFDVAIVQKTGEGFEVIAEAGLPDLGGLDFDNAILEHVGKTQERTDPDEWKKLNRPTDTASRRAQRALSVDIREGKESLSRHPHTDIPFPAPFSDVHITRSEFEDLIRPNLARSVELLATTIGKANLTPAQLAGVYLVGGSSRVPLVARLIQEGMGITPATLDQPEATVATGALYLNVGNNPGARAAAPNPTSRIPQTGQPGRPAAPGSGAMGGPTQRVNSGELPNIQRVRHPQPGPVHRIPPPDTLRAAPLSATIDTARPPTSPGPAPRAPQSGPFTAPRQGPASGVQPQPTTGGQPIARAPLTGATPTGPDPRPASGSIARPPTGPNPVPPTPRPAPQPPRPMPATPQPSSAPSSSSSGSSYNPIIWGAIVGVSLILIVVLILQLA